MDQESQEKNTMDSLMAAWMKSATDFWKSGAKMWSSASDTSTSGLGATQGFSDQSQKSWQSAAKFWQSFFSNLSTPEAVETFFRGASSSPEVFMKMSRVTMDGYAAFYQQWLKKSGNLAQPEKPYQFENLDENLFRSLKELYEKEVQPFLNVPQLGLSRFYQERMSEALDKFNIYRVTVAEFVRMLYLPVEKSLRVMGDKIEALSKEGKLSENFKDYYDMWIKVLEGHYMTLFKSPEYLNALSNTLNAAEEFKMARHNMLTDIMQTLPIPTNKDMDELYKEIYLLKKTVKKMAKKMAEEESSTRPA